MLLFQQSKKCFGICYRLIAAALPFVICHLMLCTLRNGKQIITLLLRGLVIPIFVNIYFVSLCNIIVPCSLYKQGIRKVMRAKSEMRKPLQFV